MKRPDEEESDRKTSVIVVTVVATILEVADRFRGVTRAADEQVDTAVQLYEAAERRFPKVATS